MPTPASRSTPSGFVPLMFAAVQLRLSREQMIRRICTGELAGELRDGRWLVHASALPDAIAVPSSDRAVSSSHAATHDAASPAA